MADQEIVLLDGTPVSFPDITITCSIIGGESWPMTGVKEISSKCSVKKEQQKNPDGTVAGQTTGVQECSAGMTLFRSAYQAHKRRLAKSAPTVAGLKRTDLVKCTLTVIHDPIGSEEIYHREIREVTFNGSDVKNAQGPGVDEVAMELSPSQVVDIIDGEEVLGC